MKPAKRDVDPQAASHAGRHGDFSIVWFAASYKYNGWFVVPDSDQAMIGPFHTSQAAFGAVKDAIDSTT